MYVNPTTYEETVFCLPSEKRAGILKPQVLSTENGVVVPKNRSRQNAAMQAILRRTQEQETKQVLLEGG